MKKPFLVMILVIAALMLTSNSSTVVPIVEAGSCDTYIMNCMNAAQSQYQMCVISGGSTTECSAQKYWFFEACVAGTGCVPINN